MKFELPELKFNADDLKGFMSADTLKYHYGKHHQAYADKANAGVEGSQYEDMSTEDIIKDTSGKSDKAGIFNNVAQFYNHNLFWEIMESGDKSITPEFEAKIAEKFGSFNEFKDEFASLAASQFGSGWTWLVKEEDGSLGIYKTSNAENPLTSNQYPLMACDVWEHAYYLDYQNQRPLFIKNFLDHLVNWKVVEKRFNG